jgi:hypothetical protein
MKRERERASRQRRVSTSVVMRVSVDILARMDALAPHFSTKARDATRSDILRALIDAGLESVEQDLAGGNSAAEVLGIAPSNLLREPAPRSGRKK